jgi:hypothetical protein
MKLTSLAQQLGFTYADLLSLGGEIHRVRAGGFDYAISARLNKALFVQALVSYCNASDVLVALRNEVLHGEGPRNGPVAARLGLVAADLLLPDHFAAVSDRYVEYKVSGRLVDAMRADAAQRNVSFSQVFFDLQRELHGMISEPEAQPA